MTSVLDRQTDDHGNAFIDTPGLSDLKQASEEIVKALKFGGLYNIFFVLTLEEGRIRPDDKTTMGLVLGAAPEVQHSYSIIINRVSTGVSDHLNDPSDFSEFLALLNETLPGTNSVFFNKEDDSLESKSNAIPVLTPKLLEFLKFAPVVNFTPENIKPIKEEAFDALKEIMTAQLKVLQEDRKVMEQRLAKQDEQFKEITRLQALKDEQHLAELKAHREQISLFQSQLLEQQKENIQMQRNFQEKQLQHEKEMNQLRLAQVQQQTLIAEKQREHEIEMRRMQQQIEANQGEERRNIELQAAARDREYQALLHQMQAQNQQLANRLVEVSRSRPEPSQPTPQRRGICSIF